MIYTPPRGPRILCAAALLFLLFPGPSARAGEILVSHQNDVIKGFINLLARVGGEVGLSLRRGNLLLVTQGPMLRAFDPDAADRPALLAELDLGGEPTSWVDHGDFLYVALGKPGSRLAEQVRIIDLSDPAQPVPRPSPIEIPTDGDFTRVWVRDGVLCVSSGFTTLRYDLAKPHLPKLIDREPAAGDLPAAADQPATGTMENFPALLRPRVARAVCVVRDVAYVLDAGWGIIGFDCRDPKFPRRMLGYPIAGASGLWQDEATLFVVVNDREVRVLDCGEPGKPVEGPVLHAPGPVASVRAARGQVYLALAGEGEGERGVQLWKPATGAATLLPTAHPIHDTLADGERVFLAGRELLMMPASGDQPPRPLSIAVAPDESIKLPAGIEFRRLQRVKDKLGAFGFDGDEVGHLLLMDGHVEGRPIVRYAFTTRDPLDHIYDFLCVGNRLFLYWRDFNSGRNLVGVDAFDIRNWSLIRKVADARGLDSLWQIKVDRDLLYFADGRGGFKTYDFFIDTTKEGYLFY